MSRITGSKKIFVTTVDGRRDEITIRQIPVRQFDEFADLLGGSAEKVRLGSQAHGLVSLFTGLPAGDVDNLDHASVQEIVAVGLQLNSGFFASYPATLQKGIAGVTKAAEATAKSPSPSSAGSGTASPAPDSAPTPAGT
jgi:hypothetical protein